MITDEDLSRRFKGASEAMPLRPPQIQAVLPRAKAASRRYVAALVAAFIVTTLVAVVAVPRIADLFREEGNIVISPPETSLALKEVRPVVESFARGMLGEAAPQTWYHLTPRAKEAIGGFQEWERKLKSVKYLYSWIAQRNHDLLLSPLPDGRAVVVAAEPEPRNGSWLLSAFAVREVEGRVLVDLDLDRQVSLIPEFPVFEAGSAPSCHPRLACPTPDDSALLDALPTVSPGDTFSVLLEPADKVEDVRFSLGGDDWVADAELDYTGESVRATADFDAEGLPRRTVFLVSIIRPDGGVDAYGYRVDVSD